MLSNELNEMHTQSPLGMQLYDCSRQLNHMFSLASAELNYMPTPVVPGEKWENRPDLVSRVYRMKLLMLLDLIQNKNAFGQPAVVVGVTEYQKCSLPHCHILVCLEVSD